MTRLEAVELATGVVFGGTPCEIPLGVELSPPAALERAVAPAVRSERCFVSFSGGRDSSAVLAAAAAVARREGHPLPVPITLRAGEVPQSDETEWQEAVVRALGIDDWIRIEVRDELDAVGPYARKALERHGLLWPFNVHFHSPMLEQAAGGTLLTGAGGDELWLSSSQQPVGRRRRLLQLAPAPVRRALLARRVAIDFPWLTERGRRAACTAAAADMLALPRTTRDRMAEMRGTRGLATAVASLERLAGDAGASIAHPLLDLQLWGAVAAAAPREGFAHRNDALAAAAGHLLPRQLVGRSTKASFDGLFFHDHSRAAARAWRGGGLPADVVDEVALAEHWAGEVADSHSLTMLQSVWLASAQRAEQPRRHLVEQLEAPRTDQPQMRELT